MNKYTHQELNKEQVSIAGHYVPITEARLKYNGREVLYVVGQAVIDTSCCGAANFLCALVPGYIVEWQSEKGEGGFPVTEVESVVDEDSRKRIKEIIKEAECVSQVEFW